MIGQNIKRMRLLRGWSQEELAHRMGYKDKSAINKIEKNKNDGLTITFVVFPGASRTFVRVYVGLLQNQT